MKGIAWMTFVLTLLIALSFRTHESYDQPARNQMSQVNIRIKNLEITANPMGEEGKRDFSPLQSALKDRAQRRGPSSIQIQLFQ